MASLNGKLVLFGGSKGLTSMGDTWTWDGASWTALGVNGPAARNSAVVVALAGTMFLFGGDPSQGTSFTDSWTWNGAAWSPLSIGYGPVAPAGAVIAVP